MLALYAGQILVHDLIIEMTFDDPIHCSGPDTVPVTVTILCEGSLINQGESESLKNYFFLLRSAFELRATSSVY